MSRIPVLRTSPQVWQLLGPALYSESPLLAITLRELFQNARDACLAAGREPQILIGLKADACFTQGVLFCDDNGIGMDEDTILDRFLVLGESKKSAGSTGGFGIAKATILGACSWWELHTRDLFICYDHLEQGRPIDHVQKRVGTRVILRYDPPGDDRQSRAISLNPYKFARGVSWIAHSDTPCRVQVELEGMDGLALLEHVWKQYPRTIRLVLSEDISDDTSMKAAATVHQYLNKPSDAIALRSILQRALALNGLLNNDMLEQLTSRLDSSARSATRSHASRKTTCGSYAPSALRPGSITASPRRRSRPWPRWRRSSERPAPSAYATNW